MKDVDFSICEFINDELSFLTYFDFCKNAKIIKAYYKVLENDAKRFYKWYVYANIHIDENYKNIIWNYLNANELDITESNDDEKRQTPYEKLLDALNSYKVR